MDFPVNRCPIIKLIQEQKTGDKRSQRNPPFKQGEKYVGGVEIGKGERKLYIKTSGIPHI
jgi:hypothetical protein